MRGGGQPTRQPPTPLSLAAGGLPHTAGAQGKEGAAAATTAAAATAAARTHLSCAARGGRALHTAPPRLLPAFPPRGMPGSVVPAKAAAGRPASTTTPTEPRGRPRACAPPFCKGGAVPSKPLRGKGRGSGGRGVGMPGAPRQGWEGRTAGRS